MPSSIRSAPAAAAASPASTEASSVRVAAHQVGHQRRPLAVRAEAAGDPVDPGGGDAHASPSASTSARSLSPRPERVTRSSAGRRVREQPGERVGRLERGQDSLELARRVRNAASGVLVRHRHVANAPGVAQVGVLGPDARIVEPGGHRVGLEDLPLLVLEHRGHRAVQHAARARWSAGAEWRMRVEPLARRLDSDQLDVGVVDEPAKVPIAFDPPPTQAITRSGSRAGRPRAPGRGPRRRSCAGGRARATG